MKKAEKDILKNNVYKFSLLEIGKIQGLMNPKEVFSIAKCRLAAFYENGFLLLRLTSKNTKEKLLAAKLAKRQRHEGAMEVEESSAAAGSSSSAF